MNRLLLVMAFTHPEFELFTAENGKVAVDWCLKYKFDLIFLDINMPLMDGFEALSRIRNIESDVSHRTIIIALTGGYSNMEKTLKEADFDEVEFKPIDLRKIKGLVKTFLEVDI